MLTPNRLILVVLMIALPIMAHSRAKLTPLDGIDYIEQEIIRHPGSSAVYVLDQGEDALIARAWLTDNARYSIDVQYFIWSHDNVGILAMEALLRAAERGVKVRVIIDDLLVETPDKTLLALAKHPNIHIRIYNPKSNVGVPLHTRLLNAASDFRGLNQRMHDKTFIVDSKIGITGGRNMADEYYDYNHQYNFRDRDALLMGYVATAMSNSFNNFWHNQLTVPVEQLFDGIGLMQEHIRVTDEEVQSVYQWLHGYAQLDRNFDPVVRQAIEKLPQHFPVIAEQLVWGDIRFISDDPGKNGKKYSFNGGGRTSRELAMLLRQAQSHVTIQSPYLVLTKEAKALFRELIQRGVKISISTNSMASTDNIQAFSGYKNQRDELLAMGIEIYEFKPWPKNQQLLMKRYEHVKNKNPIFAIHAKTLVVDSQITYIGTFNLDPRSVNLNTEVGVLIYNSKIAQQVEAYIKEDMSADNSWNAATDDPDQYNSLGKKSRILFWGLMPIQPLL